MGSVAGCSWTRVPWHGSPSSVISRTTGLVIRDPEGGAPGAGAGPAQDEHSKGSRVGAR